MKKTITLILPALLLSSPSLLQAQTLDVNNTTFTHPSGTVNATGVLRVARFPGASPDSIANFTGGTYTFANTDGPVSDVVVLGVIAESGENAEINVSNDAVLEVGNPAEANSSSRWASISNRSAADMLVTVSDTATFTMNAGLRIGQSSDPEQAAGNVNINVSGGAFTTKGFKTGLSMGYDDFGASTTGIFNFNHSGGTVTIGADVVLGSDSDVGTDGLNTTSIYTISGGQLDVVQGVNASYGGLFIGGGGTGQFHVDGSDITDINILNEVAINANGTIKFTIDAGGVRAIDADSINFNNGTIDFDLDGFIPAENTIYTIVNTVSGTVDIASANLSPEDVGIWSIAQNGNNLEATYIGVPEPSTYALLLGFAAVSFAYARKRRQA